MNISKNYGITKNQIIDSIQECLNIGRPSVYVARIKRREGKTRTMSDIVQTLCENIPNFKAIFVSDTIKQAEENTIEQGYFTFVESDRWRRGSRGNYTCDNGSSIIIGAIGNEMMRNRLRGKGANFIWVDEAQLSMKPNAYLTILGAMKEDKNVVFAFTGTGGKSGNLLQTAEGWLKRGLYPGKRDKFDVYELLERDPCEERQKELQETLNQYTLYRDDGTLLLDGKDNPGFIREYMVEDSDDGTEGELVFPNWKDDLIIEDYEIDYTQPFYVTMDYGRNDPFAALFSQIIGSHIYVFHEIFLKEKGRPVQLCSNAVLEALELYNIDYLKQHKTFFYGDQHGGAGPVWSEFLDKLFGSPVDLVGVSHEGLPILNQMFYAKQIHIHQDCHNLLKHIKQIRYKENTSGELKKDHNFSHTIDCLAYLVQTEYSPEASDVVLTEAEIQNTTQDIKNTPQQYFDPLPPRPKNKRRWYV